MKVIQSKLKGLYVIEPDVFKDTRGYFLETYSEKRYLEHNLNAKFVQDNESLSSYGVVRGLHFQIAPYAQTKLLRVVYGKILDIALDIRQGSETYGQYCAVELSAENKEQFYIPRGFAHGFAVLSETAIVNYKCDNFYNKDAERGIYPLDKTLNIDWKIQQKDMIISEKDMNWSGFASKR